MRFTDKAELEIATLRIEAAEAFEILSALGPDDFDTTLRSSSTGEVLHLFRWVMPGLALYINVALRDRCVVISFHEERDDEEGRAEN